MNFLRWVLVISDREHRNAWHKMNTTLGLNDSVYSTKSVSQGFSQLSRSSLLPVMITYFQHIEDSGLFH